MRSAVHAAAGWAVLAMGGPLFAGSPIGTAFTYQGQLKQAGVPYSGSADFEFALFDAAANGNPVGSVFEANNIQVNNGLFTVETDFGSAAFDGDERWIEVAVRVPHDPNDVATFTTLTTRQAVLSAPHALHTRGIHVDEVGHVGIGTVQPLAGLHIEGPGFPESFLYLNSTGGNHDAGMRLIRDGITKWHVFNREDTGDAFSLHNFAFQPVLVATQSGRVGIGTTTPSNESALHIQSADDNFGVLVDALGVPGSAIGLHSETSGYASLAKNAFWSGDWQRFDELKGAFVQEVEPNGNVTMRMAGPGSGGIVWNTALIATAEGRIGMGTNVPAARLDVLAVGQTAVSGLSNGVGVFGEHASAGGTFPGVWGETDSTSAGASGVRGVVSPLAPGDSSAGIRGINNGTGAGGFGVHGSQAGSGIGVYGVSPGGTGVFGQATDASGTTYGVRGHTVSPDGFAGYFEGMGYFSGNVGIGTTSPDNKLHVMKGSAGVVTGYSNAPLVVENSSHAYINLLTPDANERGMLFGSPTAGATAGGIIYNAAATPEGLQFRTGGNFIRMVIDSTGDVGIGTTSPAAGFKLDVIGNIRCTSLTETSSRTLKRDVQPIPDALKKLLSLQGVTFRWNEESGGNMDLGLIAEDVAEVFPELVTWSEDGSHASGLKYAHLIAVAVEAVKEQQREIDELKQRLVKLEAILPHSSR